MRNSFPRLREANAVPSMRRRRVGSGREHRVRQIVHAHVLEPKELKEGIAKTASALVDIYRGN